MHDRAREHRELLAALRALPKTALSQLARRSLATKAIARPKKVVPLDASAMRANRLTVPAHFLKKFVGSGLGGNSVCQGWKADFHVPIVSNGCISPLVHMTITAVSFNGRGEGWVFTAAPELLRLSSPNLRHRL